MMLPQVSEGGMASGVKGGL